MLKQVFVFLLLRSFITNAYSQGGINSVNDSPRTDSLLTVLFRNNPNPIFIEIITHPEKYRLQIIYTRIDRDRKNRPSFTNYYFNYDPQLYFNPASMVKMPLAFLSLEKHHRLNRKGISKYTTVVFDSTQPWHRPLYKDTSAIAGHPTLAHFIKRAFLISENDPYNRMYQWVGQSETNRGLHGKGYPEARITRQFMGQTAAQNRATPPVRFLDASGQTVYAQPALVNTDSFNFSRRITLGDAYMNSRDSLVQGPFDFTQHNNIALGSLQRMLQSVLFPRSAPASQRFDLGKDDYAFLYRWLSQYPSETDEPKYDTAQFYDSYAKFFFRDSTRRMPSGVRVFNKVGWSYGFLTDVSYVADFENGVEFFLSATLYVNSDGVINDGKYDYITVGHPFLYELGQTIYRYEKNRSRKYKPDLSAFRIEYGHRNPNDKRKALQEVDN